jgi:AraC-like DNA-binding protein
MVSNRCKMYVKEELKQLGVHFVLVDLGEVDLMEELTPEQKTILSERLLQSGLELMDDKKAILIERIKNTIITMVYNTDEILKTNFSVYLSEKLDYDYTYLSNVFSEVQGTTIAQFVILHKIERIKELIIYDELSISEIAWKMNYSSVAHLSNQFKKMTGLTPSTFKNLRKQPRTSVEDIGNNN